MMNAFQLVRLTVSLEQREVDHPQEAEVIRLLNFSVLDQKFVIVQSDATQQSAL